MLPGASQESRWREAFEGGRCALSIYKGGGIWEGGRDEEALQARGIKRLLGNASSNGLCHGPRQRPVSARAPPPPCLAVAARAPPVAQSPATGAGAAEANGASAGRLMAIVRAGRALVAPTGGQASTPAGDGAGRGWRQQRETRGNQKTPCLARGLLPPPSPVAAGGRRRHHQSRAMRDSQCGCPRPNGPSHGTLICCKSVYKFESRAGVDPLALRGMYVFPTDGGARLARALLLPAWRIKVGAAAPSCVSTCAGSAARCGLHSAHKPKERGVQESDKCREQGLGVHRPAASASAPRRAGSAVACLQREPVPGR